MTEAIHNTVIWCDPLYAPLAAAAVDLMTGGVRVTGVGGPPSQAVGDLAARYGLEATDDARRLLLENDNGSILLLTREPPLDRELLTAACERAAVLSVEPLAASVREAVDLGLSGEPGERKLIAAERVVTLPQMNESPGCRAATHAEQALGDVRGVTLESTGREMHGSLLARLYDAWVTVMGLVDVPLSIDASLAGKFDPRDDLRAITGTMAAHARTPSGAAVTLMVSDRAGHTRRRLHALGAAGEFRVDDVSYELVQVDGRLIDAHDASGQPATLADLVADQWRRSLERGSPGLAPVPPPRRLASLACCEACLLSARTGEPESPRRVMEMQR